jgi:NAD(P)-dependent dehydrogenase (short-subunit alcohol dehydrogenase family)
MRFKPDLWSIIVGGSSGFGLATAQKLAAHGMNLCIVHRDRRGAMRKIEPAFEDLRSKGISLVTFNLDGLSDEGRTHVLDSLSEQLGETGKVRMLLHSVAFGNLKLLAPIRHAGTQAQTREKLADRLGSAREEFSQAVQDAFENGEHRLHPLADPPAYNDRQFLEHADFSRTVHAMGYDIVEWVADIFKRGMFADDARVLSLTSEGNSIAWRGYAAVSAAKAVLESVSRSMAVEFAPYGIRSNVIQAGVTDTQALQAIPGSKHIKAQAALRNPFGRLTTPEDVANVIFLLCLDEAAWINGALICADGGERIA